MRLSSLWLSLAGMLIGTQTGAAAAPEPFPPLRVEDRVVRYPIYSRSIAALRIQLENHGPLAVEGGQGRTRSEFEILSKFEQQGDACHLIAMELRMHITTTLPEWLPPNKIAARQLAQWHEALGTLQRHEAGHRAQALATATELRETLARLAPQPDCERGQWAIDRHFQRAILKLKLRAARYDSRTLNGLHDDPLNEPPGARDATTATDQVPSR